MTTFAGKKHRLTVKYCHRCHAYHKASDFDREHEYAAYAERLGY